MINLDNYKPNKNICCENEFCIYQQQGHCILSNIELNTFGACDSCIYVNIDSKQLKTEKLKLLSKFNN